MSHAPHDSTPAGALFDVESLEASTIAGHHLVTETLPDDASPAERILRGGLPLATTLRWQPLRVGLVNLYLFDNEVFPFCDGRLLLRGDNGAGKSRVLALTLPLLLDGRLHPTRVEPDRDSNRQVAWNLLMDEHPDRTGYTWIEFGRVDENGSSHFLTLGIGMRGVRGRGITDHWMFVTRQRIGQSLSLITPQRRVATRRHLTESLDEHGQLFESSREYRRAIDEALFRLGDRYDALLDLLLQLRQPQLAKKLDLAGLEAALVQAMPPISQTLLSDAADAFRSLDQERETLHGLQQARLTVQEFLRPYRRHLRLGIHRAAGRLRSRHGEFEQAGKDLRDAEKKRNTLLDESRQLTDTRDDLIRQQKATTAALRTLQADPAMKHAERLNSARQLHDAAKEVLTAARDAAERQKREVEEAAAESASFLDEANRRLQNAARLREIATESAAPIALRDQHVAEFRRLVEHTAEDTQQNKTADGSSIVPTADLPAIVDDVESNLMARVDHWLRTGDHLATLHRQAEETSETLRSMVRRLDDAQDRLQSAGDAVVAAEEALQEQRRDLRRAYDRWWSDAQQLAITPDDHAALLEEWVEWSPTSDGLSPDVREADTAMRRLTQALAVERSALIQQQELLAARQEQLNDELQDLHAGTPSRSTDSGQPDNQSGTPVPGLYDSRVREELTGAALWEVVEFLPQIPHEERAGWEASLESSGLLNAWIHPDGGIPDPQALNTILTLSGSPVSDPRKRLSRVLVPAGNCRDHGLEHQAIADILDRIGAGINAAPVWVDASGRWQNGPLSGRWSRSIPQYVGDDVRSASRARRIEELDRELNQLVHEFAATQVARERLDQREQMALEHRRSLPDDGRLRMALAEKQAAERQQYDARQRVTEAAAIERSQRQRREHAVTERDTLARDVGLEDWHDRPDSLLLRIRHYRDQLTNCLDAWRIAGSAADRNQRQADFEQRKRDEQQQQVAQLQSAEQNQQTRSAALDELQRSVGIDAQEITRRIAQREQELADLDKQITETGEQFRNAEKNAARLEARLEQFDEHVRTADVARRDAADALAELAATRLIATADAKLEDIVEAPASLTATVELAQRIEALNWRVADMDSDEAWKRSQTSIYNALEPLKGRLTSFSMNAEPEFLGDHVCRVQVRHEGDLVTPDLLIKRLQADVDEHEQVLSEKERSILERHLLGEVAGELRERIQQAAELVDSMNREVSRRPMRTGMQMRFRWEIDEEGPVGLAGACRILSTEAATWSGDDRRVLGDFLQQQIVVSRDQDDAGSRLEQLAAALDYRRWHRLRIDRRAAKGQAWKPLTRRTYGSGSGGEKAIALTLPQVAAAAAYYRTADPLAPRLILLDEVFAGISSNNRAACLELLTAFELDVVMTSESEWGCYATVPQLAICQLTRVPDLAAIDNTLFIWNGKERRSE